MHRFLVDRTRQTRKGKLFVRFRADLRGDPRFVGLASGRWTLQGGPEEAAEFDIDRLATVAWGLRLRVSPWAADTEREGPPADKASRLRLLQTVLREAEGSLTVAQLASVGERRFPRYGHSEPVSYDGWDDYALPAAPPADAAVGASEEAQRIWGALTLRQQAAVPYLDLSARAAADALGMGHTAANNLQRQTKAVLAELIGSDMDEAVARELVALAQTGARTDRGGSPSRSNTGRLAAPGRTEDEDDEDSRG